MQTFDFPHIKHKETILALGAESAGNFSAFHNQKIYFSKDFGDLLNDENYKTYKKELAKFIARTKIKPKIILTDLHPDFKTTLLGKELAEKYKAKHIQIQHHIAHIFSQLGKNMRISNFQFPISKQFSNSNNQIQNYFYGIVLDGTGLGTDEKIWGGEIFKITKKQETRNKQILNSNNQNRKQEMKIQRIGHLENQTMLGGELAIREPARMLISILSKFLTKKEIRTTLKKLSPTHDREMVKNFGKEYSEIEFDLLYNQLQQNFNCVETSSCGRIFDAVSVLLGFAKNQRNSKHEASYLLEENSTIPYKDIKPKIDMIKRSQISNSKFLISNQYPIIKFSNEMHILNTTFLFQYLIKNLHKDKKRLAATAQLYIAQGLEKIIKKHIAPNIEHKTRNIVLSGGLSNNKIILNYFKNKKSEFSVIENLNIPRTDAGISFGQIINILQLRKFDYIKTTKTYLKNI